MSVRVLDPNPFFPSQKKKKEVKRDSVCVGGGMEMTFDEKKKTLDIFLRAT